MRIIQDPNHVLCKHGECPACEAYFWSRWLVGGLIPIDLKELEKLYYQRYLSQVKNSEKPFVCEACGRPIIGYYTSIGGNWVPPISPKIYHPACVPALVYSKPSVTERAPAKASAKSYQSVQGLLDSHRELTMALRAIVQEMAAASFDIQKYVDKQKLEQIIARAELVAK